MDAKRHQSERHNFQAPKHRPARNVVATTFLPNGNRREHYAVLAAHVQRLGYTIHTTEWDAQDFGVRDYVSKSLTQAIHGETGTK